MSWALLSKPLSSDRGICCRIAIPNGELTFADVVNLWRRDSAFADFVSDELARCKFEAFRWELPPVTRSTFARPFEFVLLDDPLLGGREPEPEAFAQQFAARTRDKTVVSFPNLGGDAILVAPCPVAGLAYPDFATFLRTALADQRREFWRIVGDAVTNRLSERPLWLSTAGGGVAWLHVRLDSLPKYYHHAPYSALE